MLGRAARGPERGNGKQILKHMIMKDTNEIVFQHGFA
jgi:hypothetical protein